eukprot:363626-Chlamydomonas_euryale.AAC.1
MACPLFSCLPLQLFCHPCAAPRPQRLYDELLATSADMYGAAFSATRHGRRGPIGADWEERRRREAEESEAATAERARQKVGRLLGFLSASFTLDRATLFPLNLSLARGGEQGGRAPQPQPHSELLNPNRVESSSTQSTLNPKHTPRSSSHTVLGAPHPKQHSKLLNPKFPPLD